MKAATAEKASKPRKRTKAYYLPVSLTERVGILAVKLHVPDCDVVERLILATLDEFERNAERRN